jgi:hypothetical protein
MEKYEFRPLDNYVTEDPESIPYDAEVPHIFTRNQRLAKWRQSLGGGKDDRALEKGWTRAWQSNINDILHFEHIDIQEAKKLYADATDYHVYIVETVNFIPAETNLFKEVHKNTYYLAPHTDGINHAFRFALRFADRSNWEQVTSVRKATVEESLLYDEVWEKISNLAPVPDVTLTEDFEHFENPEYTDHTGGGLNA